MIGGPLICLEIDIMWNVFYFLYELSVYKILTESKYIILFSCFDYIGKMI